MDAVGTADAGRIFEFNGAAAQNVAEIFQILDEDIRSLLEHIAHGRILYVCRRQAQVNIFAGFADVFRKGGNKGGNIMMCFRFDFMDAFDRKLRFFANFLGRFLRHVAELGLGFAGQDFYLFQRIPFVEFCPNLTHFRFRIAFNHVESLLFSS